MDFDFTSERQKMEIFISCRSLDIIGKSDPYVLFYLKEKTAGDFSLKGQTETIKDNLNPNFLKTFIVDFIFEIKQECKFEVWNFDSELKSDFIGSVNTTIGEISGSKGQTLILNIMNSNSNVKSTKSKFIIKIEKVMHSNEKYFLKFKAEKLSTQSIWLNLVSGTSPFLIFYKSREDGSWLKVFESVVMMDSKNPIWKGFEINSKKLNEGDHLRPFKVECWNWKKSGTHKYFGECFVTIENLLQNQRTFELKNPQKKNKSIFGFLICEDFSLTIIPDFFDYLRGGLQLNFILAIDFTNTNGIAQKTDSLHAIHNDGKMNQYQEAIEKVGEIILNYDYDKVIPAFGFGAKPHFPNLFQPTVSHCFPLSGNLNQTEIYGLKGIFEIYVHALNYIDFSGPTLIHPIIEKSKSIASDCKTKEKNIYNILLILTDGEINEMDATITSIIEASQLPLSIIIVGIGESDFGKMVIFDGDEGLMNRNDIKAERDIVQFVPFREFKGNGVALAEHVLEEIPEQVVKYMLSIGKKPGEPINIDVDKLIEKWDCERQSFQNIRTFSQDIRNRPMPFGIYNEDKGSSKKKEGEKFIMPKADNFNEEEKI